MSRWQSGLLLFRIGLLGFLVYIMVDGMPALVRFRMLLEAPPPPKYFEPFTWVDPSKGLRILNFYGYPAESTPGAAVSLCFGVAGAMAVRIEPPIAELKPSLNRCLEDRPRRTTRYTLIATDDAGHERRLSFELPVKAAPLYTRKPRPAPPLN